MSQKFKKSWLSAAIGGALLSTMGTSAMALDVADNEDLNLVHTTAAITANAPTIDETTTTLSGSLYQNAGGTIFGATDANGDEDAFKLYLDGTSTFDVSLDFIDATLTGTTIRPLIMLLQDFGGGLYKKAISNTSTDGTLAGAQSWSYDPNNVSVGAGLQGVGGAGNYILLVSAFGNAATNPGSAGMATGAFDGATWAGDVMQDAGSTAASYTATVSGATTASAVPVPAAVWLFGSGLMGLVGVARRRKA